MEFQLASVGEKTSFWKFLKSLEEQSPYLSKRSYSQMEQSLGNQQIYLLKDSERTYGYLEFQELGNDEYELLQIAVLKSFRKSGSGRSLWENFVKEKNIKKLYLEVHHKNIAAIEFYKKLGFQLDGKRPNYYQDGGDALLMSWVDAQKMC